MVPGSARSQFMTQQFMTQQSLHQSMVPMLYSQLLEQLLENMKDLICILPLSHLWLSPLWGVFAFNISGVQALFWHKDFRDILLMGTGEDSHCISISYLSWKTALYTPVHTCAHNTHTYTQTCIYKHRGTFQRKQRPQPYSLTNPDSSHTGHFCLVCVTKIRPLGPMSINKIISFLERSQTLNMFKLTIYSKIIVWLGIYLPLLNNCFI